MAPPIPETTHASAPGKLIIVGEHVATYGVPALVAAIDRRCVATVERVSSAGVLLNLVDLGIRASCTWVSLEAYASSVRRAWCAYRVQPSERNFAALRGDDPAHLVKAMLGDSLSRLAIGTAGGVAVSVRSRVPVSRGLGSSAATAVALAGAIVAMSGTEPTLHAIDALATVGERAQHGRPSGIDQVTALHGGCLCLIGGRVGHARELPLGDTADGMRAMLDGVEIYDMGASPESTGAVVTATGHRLRRDRVLLHRMADTSYALIDAIRDGAMGLRRFAGAVAAYETCLERLGVVPPAVRQVVRDIESCGGAAKICGAGTLTGPGAGALLVVWPEGAPARPPPSLVRCPRIDARLGVGGVSWESV